MMVLMLALLACKGDDPATSTVPTPTPEPTPSSSTPYTHARATSCDPLDPSVCALPWPSSYFQQPDEASASGWQHHLADDTLPVSESGIQLHPRILGHTDGFSTMAPLMAFFGEVDLAGVISHADLDAYTAADALTVVIDTATGERVPHFVELDHLAPEGERMLILRPVVPLDHASHYVVGLRGLSRPDGTPLAPSAHFQALRDGTADEADPDLAWRQAAFDQEVFPALEAQGFARDELLLAWDFHTVSVDGSVGDMLWMRDDALARWESGPKEYAITEVVDEDCSVEGAKTARTVRGTFAAPRYTESPEPMTFLARDADGTPAYVADIDVPFVARIPCSVAADPGRRLVHYGHGLLGTKEEITYGWISTHAESEGYVLYAQDWDGMAEADQFPILGLIGGDFSDFPQLPERSMQGMAQKLVGLRFARDVLANDPAMAIDGVAAIDSSKVSYYGNSQGGILGAVYMALSTDVERGVLGVAGMPYSLLLPRSNDFELFLLALKGQYEDPLDLSLLIGVIQNAWDVAEPAGYAHFVNQQPLPGTPSHEVLIQVGVGDAQVTTLGAHIMARSYGAALVAPAHREVWGVPELDATFQGSALVEFYYDDGPEEPFENLPPDKSLDTHECPRREPAAHEQIDAFFETGTIIQACNGVCGGLREGLCD